MATGGQDEDGTSGSKLSTFSLRPEFHSSSWTTGPWTSSRPSCDRSNWTTHRRATGGTCRGAGGRSERVSSTYRIGGGSRFHSRTWKAEPTPPLSYRQPTDAPTRVHFSQTTVDRLPCPWAVTLPFLLLSRRVSAPRVPCESWSARRCLHPGCVKEWTFYPGKMSALFGFVITPSVSTTTSESDPKLGSSDRRLRRDRC